MVRRTLMALLFAGALAIPAADIVVHVPPHRRRLLSSGDLRQVLGVFGINGYHRWDGSAYVWAPGRWEMPPRPHAHWVAHHWVHRNGGWVMVEGHWR
jgi:WXXGXW repeat (2 copies)